MNLPRLPTIVVIANLIATLLVYREVRQLRERPDEPVRPAAALASPPQGLQPQADAVASAAAVLPRQGNSDVAAATADAADDLTDIRNRFATQHDDTAWTAQVQQALQTVAGASAHYAGITLGGVECKAQICKLPLGYTDLAVFDAYISELTMAFKYGPAVSVYLDAPAAASGYSTVDVYLVRE